jgi:hypothetical protein
MSLNEYSTEQLKQAVKDREEAERLAAKPKPLDNIDWSRVIAGAQEEADCISEHGYDPKDSEHWIYEEVMKAVFGNDYFDWYEKGK